MKVLSLLPSEITHGRNHFYIFTFFNVFSYLLISSNIIILYAIKLGADSFTIGLLSSFVQVAYIFMLIGRIFIKKTGAVKLMGTFWTIRYLMMIPVLFTPFLYNRGRADIALLVLIFSVLGFHTARGIAITSYNPIVGQLAGTKDRGVFLARIQIINHILVISVGIAIALLLGKNAPFSRYILFIATGITAGLIGCYFLFRLPEIKGSALGFAEKFTSSIFLSLKDSRFRQFIIVLFTASLALTTLLPFSILFFKRIYGNSDSQVIFFTVFGGLGALSMAILNGFMIDRIGSKPLILIYTLITSLVVIPIIIAPTFKTATLQFVFAGLVFFLSYMGTNGILNTSQNYFFALIKPQERLNLGILYFLTIGIAGVIGSLAGGTGLEYLEAAFNRSPVNAFRIFFGIILILFILSSILILRLKSIGAYSVRDAFAIIFSPRDLRAIRLLNRLGKTKTIHEEMGVIQALGTSGSIVTKAELLQKLHSPSFFIRAEALHALTNVPVDNNIETVLISEVKNHKFTTAYIAAEIIGRKKLKSGEKVLLQALKSTDYFLVGKAMVALAQLKSIQGFTRIMEIIEKTSNPRVIIHGAHALEIYKNKSSIPLLIRKMERKTSPYVRDEIILAIAGILDIQEWFYTRYTLFLESAQAGTAKLIDDLNLHRKETPVYKKLVKAVENITKDHNLFKTICIKLLATATLNSNALDSAPETADHYLILSFQNALNNEKILRLDRFRFLTASLLIYFYIR